MSVEINSGGCGGGGVCTEGTVCVCFFYLFGGSMNEKNRTSSDVHLCLILSNEMSQRQFVEFWFLTDIYYFNNTHSA